jgi:hypothetical protein
MEAEALHAEITRLIAVEKTLDEEFWALPEGSAAAVSTARAANQIGRPDSASGSQIVGGSWPTSRLRLMPFSGFEN